MESRYADDLDAGQYYYGEHKIGVILSEAKNPTLWVVLSGAKDLLRPRERSLDKLGTTLRVGCFATLNMTGVLPIICSY